MTRMIPGALRAIAKLPAGTVEKLVMPENKKMLTEILTYHVVAGTHDAKDLVGMVEMGGGKAKLKTVEGGNTAKTTIFDVYQSNGVIHVIDTVLMPKMTM